MEKCASPMTALRLLLTIVTLWMSAPSHAQLQDTAVKQCASRHPPGVARAHCLAPWLEDIVVRQGTARALEAAQGLVQSGVMNDCHFMSHTVGHATWRKTRELHTAFGACTTACIQGCMHGVVEASMMEASAGRVAPKQALAFCDSLGEDTLERRQCLHGLGHGIMHQRRDNVNAAVKECEALGARFERDQCLGGLWMQWAHFPLSEGAEGFRRKAPALCAAVREDLMGPCAHAVGGAAMFATGHDEVLSKAICKRLPAPQQAECNKGVQYESELLRKGDGHGHHHH